MTNQLFLLVFYYVLSTGFFHKELYVACDSVFFIAGAGHCSSYISIHWNERCGWLADQCRIQHDNFGEYKSPYIGVSSCRVTIAFCRPVFHCSVAVCVCTVYGICDILGWHRLPLSHSNTVFSDFAEGSECSVSYSNLPCACQLCLPQQVNCTNFLLPSTDTQLRHMWW